MLKKNLYIKKYKRKVFKKFHPVVRRITKLSDPTLNFIRNVYLKISVSNFFLINKNYEDFYFINIILKNNYYYKYLVNKEYKLININTCSKHKYSLKFYYNYLKKQIIIKNKLLLKKKLYKFLVK